MLQLLGERYKKQIAFFLVNIFYMGFLGQLQAGLLAAPIGNFKSHFDFKSKRLILPGDNDSGAENIFSVHAGKTKTKLNPLPDEYSVSKDVAQITESNKRESSPAIGPSQPESSTFQSAGTDNMVDLFSGNFSYNIPLMDVGGYPVSIHYNSGITMDQEASWVGLGWNINPGSITRNMRGLPDDFNGTDSITKTETIKTNKTVSVDGGFSVEIVGLKQVVKSAKFGAGVSSTLGVRYNNYMGWGIESSITPTVSSSISGGANTAGKLTASLSIANNTMYGPSISPSLFASLGDKNNSKSVSLGIGTSYNNRTGISGLQLDAGYKQAPKSYQNAKASLSGMDLHLSSYISFAVPSYTPTITMPMRNTAYSFTGKVTGEIWGLAPGISITGAVQQQEIPDKYKIRKMPAYGYMNYTRAKDDVNALMDFNREKDLTFNSESTPHIAVPVYTPDLFQISGEGTGGMFRAYRGDLGYIRDHKMETESGSDKLSTEVGLGDYVHVGADLMKVDASTTNSAWKDDNKLASNLTFKDDDTTFESAYFKNPGEQTAVDRNFYAAVGDDDLIRASLTGSGENVSLDSKFEKVRGGAFINGNVNVATAITRKERDKRTQLITYLTAEQADKYGFNKKILSYPENEFGKPSMINPGGDTSCMTGIKVIDRIGSIRKGNHLSEIDVLGNDGKKYVYGIPVYNTMQQDVTFSVKPSPTNMNKGWINYDPTDASLANKSGKDNYYSNEQTPAYAHSFLLTEILSPDYVDIRGDGVTDDDLGDAIRFNYTQVCSEKDPFQWRIPYTKDSFMANYNEGFKSESRDDKGSYTFGKKELWYLNTIESKNFIAVFTTSKERKDVINIKDSTGGFDYNESKAQRRLKQIDLYSKADWVKNGNSARPVKTVYFDYDYSLCKAVTGVDSTGKLTLTKISFSYSNGKKKNPYLFTYGGKNPDYNPASYDRWGNYKDMSGNPVSAKTTALNNYDYPYLVQDSTVAASNATAWNLTDIQTPAGGKMKITYESDDYGYVQNKRASRLFDIRGFAASPTGTPTKYIYGDAQLNEKLYVMARVPVAVTKPQEVKELYLQGITKLFFKLNVPMPADKWGNGNEWIPLYADIADAGVVSGGDNKTIWIKVKDVDGVSPFKKVAMQFLRLNLPSKAYPNSETGDDVNFKDMVKVIFSSMSGYLQMFSKFEAVAANNGWCKEVFLGNSFVRLDEPTLKRYGGGSRVKRIEIFDSWNKMTAGQQQDASYGQEYMYTTSQIVNGVAATVSSGVACYEPQIGGDENPFRIAKELSEKTNLLAPVNLMYSEEPIGESFFPAPMVGYSKVRTRTIHSNNKSANGWSETEFYTSKDFPTAVEMTPLDGSGKKPFRSSPLGQFLKIESRQYMNLSQGFKVELNDMNGKMKSQASYAEIDPANPIAYTRYYYKVDDNNADHKHLNNEVGVILGNKGEISPGMVGKDIEVMVDLRQQLSQTTSLNLGVNVDVVAAGVWPLPLPSAIPFPQKETMRFRSAAVVKIINRYGLLDSVVQMDKGSIVSTKNVIWDGESGQVVVSRTNNEFNDPVYNVNYPAYWAYDGMAPAYKNIGIDLAKTTNVRKQLKIIRGKLFDYDDNPLPNWEAFFKSGDEIIVQRGLEEDVQQLTPMAMDIPVTSDPTLCGDPKWRAPIKQYIKLWAIDASIGKEHNQGIYFIDQEGRPYSCKEIKEFRIIRSGRRNMMAAAAGSLVSLANPIRTVNGIDKIQIDAQTNVLQASAATYKDLWKVVNHWYVKDTPYIVTRNFTTTLQPTVTILKDQNGTFSYSNNAGYIVSSFFYLGRIKGLCGRHSFGTSSQSIINFPIEKIPKDAVIANATLNLSPYAPQDVFPIVTVGRGACGTKRNSFDWGKNTAYYANLFYLPQSQTSAAAKLSRITSTWTSSLQLTVPTTTDNNVAITQDNFTNLNCTGLVKDVFTRENFGFLFKEDVMSPNNETEDQNNFLSFCNTDNISNNSTGNGFVCDNSGVYCKTCSVSNLKINYNKSVDSVGQICKQFISDTVVNPYRFGILGNWHVDRSYAYYSDRDERKENDLSSAVVYTRTGGTLAGFKPFWSFGGDVMAATADTTQWNWTSAENFFNRKGYEMENYDALYRYNSGQYGYNQQLAIAATQNAKNRETFFDGLEDYDYKTNKCNYLCKDARTFDGFTITNADAHTGLYSLSLAAGQSKSITLPLTASADTAAALSIKVDSSLVPRGTVIPKGTGLTGYYVAGDNNQSLTRTDASINFNWAVNQAPDPGLPANGWLTINWVGKLQVPENDTYTFYIDYHDGRTVNYIMTVNGVQVVSLGTATVPVFLEKGKLYDIAIYATTERSHKFWTGTDNIAFNFSALWSREKGFTKTLIPTGAMYPIGADTSGSFKVQNFYCVKLNSVKPQSVILPKTAPIKGSQSLITAWVKVKDDNTNTANVDGLAPIKIQYAGLSGSDATLAPTGVRIEGWQRYEAVTKIPASATNMQLVFQPGTRNILVDDIRIHPYNSNMKSFVYDPVSLKLMAELDENNYATFYEYDDEGNLMRLKKETERGVMTIKETRSNTQTAL
ncbi:hypothetical protein [Pinibacter soli]|uniref:PA14 domain-containing protein n=1 Tax=Pinibacter soli TaxID=3044211 RepID=A0ABT6RG89_9BACT|nr:hypothetical protein [Pinibacter soli]MDI3321390.1 hypothetical protein [Pinibacter soli]